MIFLFAFRNLFRNFRKTCAIVLTVAIGVTAIYLFDGFKTGIITISRDWSIHSMFGNGQIFTENYLEKTHEKPWERWIDNYDEIEKYLKGFSEVKDVFPRLTIHALVMNGDKSIGGIGEGFDPVRENKFFIYNVTTYKGKGTVLEDDPLGVMIGEGLSKALKVEPGDNITVLTNNIYGGLTGIDLKVTGIFFMPLKEISDRFFRFNIKTAQKLIRTDKIEKIVLGLNDHNDLSFVSESIEKRFKDHEVVPMEELNKVYFTNSVKWLNSQYGIISVVILFVVIMGIFNTVSTSVFDRKKEIGNLRANGESSKDVILLLLYEGIIAGFFGSILGIILSFLISKVFLANGLILPPGPGFNDGPQVFLELTPVSGVRTFVFCWISCIIATLIAVYKISGLKIRQYFVSI